jgi:hypothetical protein
MEQSKFHQLCNAYGTAQDKFENYKTDCHLFSMEIVKELKAYYNVPESQFSLYRVSEKNGFELVTPALIHAIRLAEDHYWHFGIGLTVCKSAETLPEELILIHILFRRNVEGKCFIKYAYDDKEFEIEKGNSASYIPFFDFLFETIIKSYNEQLQQFIGVKTTRKLGYRR